MVAEHGVELDPVVEQPAIRLLELQPIVLPRGGPFVDVVAEHQHECVREVLTERHHLRGNRVLRRRAAAAVADDREFH